MRPPITHGLATLHASTVRNMPPDLTTTILLELTACAEILLRVTDSPRVVWDLERKSFSLPSETTSHLRSVERPQAPRGAISASIQRRSARHSSFVPGEKDTLQDRTSTCALSEKFPQSA
jgi:hypothetical protein